MKDKRDLLPCVRILTMQDCAGSPITDRTYTESELQTICAEQEGWHGFKDVFMISALEGNGVNHLHVRE